MTPPDPLPIDAALAALLADPARAGDLPPERAVTLLLQLTALQAALAARLQAMPMSVIPAEKRAEADRLLTVAQAAEVLSVKAGWLYRRSGKLPFARKLGGNLRFSERGLRTWAANQGT